MHTEQIEHLLFDRLGSTLETTDFSGLGKKFAGKVRDSYVGTGKRIMVVTDRLSAFDVAAWTIPCKGQVLNQLAAYWFQESADIAPNHLLSVPDPNVTVARECTPLRAEFVMRSYLTGVTSTSIWYRYDHGAREFCGHRLPEGMRKNQCLREPLLTPSTKAEKGEHDVSVSRAELIESGAVSEEHFDQAASIAAKLFRFGQERAAQRGLILVDTKYEMGVDSEGNVIVIDEIHTPDSSRYWFLEDCEERAARGLEPRNLDKEYLRRWMVERGFSGEGTPPPLPDEVRVEGARRYIETFELITGKEFIPAAGNPLRRIANTLGVKTP